MADKKISQLTALSAANLAPSTDVLAIVDTSATETKKIVAQDLINGVLNVASAVGIGTTSPGAKLHVLGSNFVGIFAGTNANTVYTEYRYNSTTTSGFIGNGSSVLSAAADSDFIVRSEGALKFATNGNNFRAVIDSSGNLGLGVTPSAWASGFRAMQVAANAALWGGTASGSGPTYLTNNVYFDGARKYIGTGAAAEYDQNAGVHSWFTASSGSANATITFTQAMTLDASGNLLVGITSARANAGDVQVSKGISFPATQSAQSDANTLDDYEEGTITDSNLGLAYATPGTSSFTYSDRFGTYTKIGRVVYFTIDIRLSSFSKGTASGDLYIVGLPFAQRNTGGFDSARCTVHLYDWTYTTSPIIATVQSNTTTIGISRMVSNDVSVNINDPKASSIIWVTGFYFV